MQSNRHRDEKGIHFLSIAVKLLIGGLMATFINGIFWIIYNTWGDIVTSIGFTFVISIGVIAFSFVLFRRKRR